MKKLMTMVGVAGFAFAATAGINDSLLGFSTVGPDKYADGKTVMDGECYALVWTKDGATFGGIDASGKAIADTDEVVLVAPVAKDGRCPNVLFQIDAEKAASLKDGSYGVYLLDTRVTKKDGSTAPQGATNGKLSLVNGYGLATDSVKAGSIDSGVSTATEKATDGGLAVAAGAAAPKNAVQPKIKSMKIEGENVRLTIENVPGFMRVNSGKDVAADDAQGAAQKMEDMAKDANGDAILYVPMPKNSASGFFKVVHN